MEPKLNFSGLGFFRGAIYVKPSIIKNDFRAITQNNTLIREEEYTIYAFGWLGLECL